MTLLGSMKMSAWQRPIDFSLVKGIFSAFIMAWISSSSPLAFRVRLALRMIFVETRPRDLRRTIVMGAIGDLRVLVDLHRAGGPENAVSRIKDEDLH